MGGMLLIDASPAVVYSAVHERCVAGIRHIAPDTDLNGLANGKVRGVLTGLRLASHDLLVIADDDVRYSRETLEAVARHLEIVDVVRPQNFFDPLPWHARLDTARMLINRMTGGDWPGTLAVRRSTLMRTGGYDGNVLFENLELVRTVEAAGGSSLCLQDLYVRRLPPETRHFWRQRVRQAYDEFARPVRLVVALSVVPLLMALFLVGRGREAVLALAVVPTVIAELGRRRAGGSRVFPISAALCGPLWVCERAICSWCAVACRLLWGGVSYHGRLLRRAAHSHRQLLDSMRGLSARVQGSAPAPFSRR